MLAWGGGGGGRGGEVSKEYTDTIQTRARGYKTFFHAQQVFAFSYLLAEKFSCSAMYSKKEFAIINSLRFIRRTNFMLR